MKAKIEIDLGNAAFNECGDGENGAEVARILHECAKWSEDNYRLRVGDTRPLYDYNGNRVGEFRVVK